MCLIFRLYYATYTIAIALTLDVFYFHILLMLPITLKLYVFSFKCFFMLPMALTLYVFSDVIYAA